MSAQRVLPALCPHGLVLSWGDFGEKDAKPEYCDLCRVAMNRNEMRDLVFRLIVKQARPNESLRNAVQEMGIFAMMDVVDLIVEALLDAYESGTPLRAVEVDKP